MNVSSLSLSLTKPRAFPAFTPASVFSGATTGLWLDPSDTSTLFQDTAGTTPVTTAGQAVARINDKSGFGYVFTQGTGASQPLYQVDARGVGYLAFDGTDDFLLSTTNYNATATDSVSGVVGFLKSSDAAVGTLVEISPTINTNNGTFVFLAPANAATANVAFQSKGTSIVGRTISGLTAPVAVVLSARSQISVPVTYAKANNVSSTAATTLGTGNFGTFSMYIGRRAGTINAFNGRLYGVVLVDKNLSNPELANLEVWMNSKVNAL